MNVSIKCNNPFDPLPHKDPSYLSSEMKITVASLILDFFFSVHTGLYIPHVSRSSH